jgi:NTP pyrophosphatase (non-canonical NTP hydrolase)
LATPLNLSQLQKLIRDLYGAKDERRGVEGTFMWFMEEVGELATALRNGTKPERLTEFADVLAWLVTLANCVGIDLDEAVRAKYERGCPGCLKIPCTCNLAEKP